MTQEVTMERLTDILNQLAEVQARQTAFLMRAPEPTTSIRIPEYHGDSDVEMFIEQFDNVWDIQGWDRQLALVKIREVLTGKARGCGRAGDIDEVKNSLRLCFGITETEARAKLGSLQRDYKVSLAEHGMLVEKLTLEAYPHNPADSKRSIMIEHFINSINNVGLQNHLMAKGPHTLAEAIRTGNEFLQVCSRRRTDRIHAVDAESDDHMINVTQPSKQMEEILMNITKLLVEQKEDTKQLMNTVLAQKRENPRFSRTNREIECWNCGRKGHTKDKCRRPVNQQTTKKTPN